MNYIETVLQPDEKLVRVGHLHWMMHFPGAIVIAAGALVFFDTHVSRLLLGGWEATGGYLALALVVVGLLLVARSKFEQWTTEIGVTDRRIIQKTGFIARRTSEMNINQVESVEVKQSVLARILGYGTLRIHGSGVGLEALEYVADPVALRTSITAR